MHGVARTRRVAGIGALSTIVAACGLTSSVPARHLECVHEDARARCEDVALRSLDAMDLAAIGPIDTIAVETIDDCAAWGRANFMSRELEHAARCWSVDVIGDRSRGWTTVFQRVEGGPVEVIER